MLEVSGPIVTSLGVSCLDFRSGHGKRGDWGVAGGVDGEAVGARRHKGTNGTAVFQNGF